MHLVVSCSLSPVSRSFSLAEHLINAYHERGQEAELIDLRAVELPFCDGGACYGDEQVQRLTRSIEAASGVVLAAPVYNYDVGGAARNLIALTGDGWKEKVVGMVAAAGGERSYMALLGLGNSLMLDFRCVLVPRWVYASKRCFDEAGRLIDETVEERLQGLADAMSRFSQALA